MVRAGALVVVDDLRPAQWLVENIRSFAENVGSLVPDFFGAYARVFHPAYRSDGGEQHRVRWAEIARANRRIAHPQMQFHRLIGYSTRYSPGYRYHDSQPGIFDEAPAEGELPPEDAAAMARVLAGHTATESHCWFAVWDGWADLDERFRGQPTFQLPGRTYYLAYGRIAAATQSAATPGPGRHRHRSCNLWWPDDHAWCVATEIDLDSTYIGASEACIEELLASFELESARLSLTAGITAFSDTLNPASGPAV
jgi:hypothetical protein